MYVRLRACMCESVGVCLEKKNLNNFSIVYFYFFLIVWLVYLKGFWRISQPSVVSLVFVAVENLVYSAKKSLIDQYFLFFPKPFRIFAS